MQARFPNKRLKWEVMLFSGFRNNMIQQNYDFVFDPKSGSHDYNYDLPQCTMRRAHSQMMRNETRSVESFDNGIDNGIEPV
ncbi:10740_t:CDS:1, partial [Ambispora gerdemannii]